MELIFCQYVDPPVPKRMTRACKFFDPSKLASELILLFGPHTPSCMDLSIVVLDEQTKD